MYLGFLNSYLYKISPSVIFKTNLYYALNDIFNKWFISITNYQFYVPVHREKYEYPKMHEDRSA